MHKRLKYSITNNCELIKGVRERERDGNGKLFMSHPTSSHVVYRFNSNHSIHPFPGIVISLLISYTEHCVVAMFYHILLILCYILESKKKINSILSNDLASLRMSQFKFNSHNLHMGIKNEIILFDLLH